MDLRGNPGGLLDACTGIADMLLPEGLIVYSETGSKNGRSIILNRIIWVALSCAG